MRTGRPASRPSTVTSGEQRRSVDARLEAGDDASASEILRAALRALDREEAALDDLVRARISEASSDPGPAIPINEVFAPLERKQAERIERRGW